MIKTIELYFPAVMFIMLYKVVLTSICCQNKLRVKSSSSCLLLESVDEILKCDHSNESY